MPLNNTEGYSTTELTEDELLDNLEYAQDRKRQAIVSVSNRASYLETISLNALGETQDFIDEIKHKIVSFSTPSTTSINDIGTTLTSSLSYQNRPDANTIGSIPTISTPSFSGSYSELSIGTLPDISAIFPQFDPVTATKAAVSMPGKPTLLPFTAAPDTYKVKDVSVPKTKSISIPKAPQLGSFKTPSFEEVSIPDFKETLSKYTIKLPGEFSWSPEKYSSGVYAQLLKAVLGGIQRGGISLGEKVEAEIFERHKSRVQTENDRQLCEAEDYFAGRGFTVPSGVLLSKLTELSRVFAREAIDASRDISISQAELLHKSNEFYIEQGRQLEGTLMQFYSENMNRSLQAKKEVLTSSVEISKMTAELARVKIEEFNAKAASWNMLLQKKIANAEEYKLKLEASSIELGMKKLLNENYETQMNAAKIATEIFSEEVRAASIMAEIEKLKLETSIASISAISIKTEENSKRIALYGAQISAEKAKIDAALAEVSFDSAKVERTKAHIDSLISQRSLILEVNKARMQEYELKIELHKKEVADIMAAYESKLGTFKAMCSAYEAETSRDSAYYSTSAEEIRAKISIQQLRLQKAIAEIDASIKGFQAVEELKMAGSEGVMQVTAQLAASAMQGISSHSSLSYSGGDSFNSAESTSYSSIKQVTTTI